MLPKIYQILTNLSCNLNCTYCYENKSNRINDIEQIKKYLDNVFERDFGIIKVDQQEDPDINLDFIGGESLMVPNLMSQTIEYIQLLIHAYEIKSNLKVSLSTNGTLLAEEGPAREFIKKWKDVLHIGFSIDGTKEIHDSARVDLNGKGSYDRAIAGYEWCKTILPPCRISAKATYTHKTVNHYGEGIINLIKLGFCEIAANGVFEENWIPQESKFIASEMNKITDYIFENNLVGKVFIKQINLDANFDMTKYKPNFNKPDPKHRSQNHCGSCKYMRCLGLCGVVYGCNRFCTMEDPKPLTDELAQEVINQYKLYPQECQECPYSEQCASCAAIPYETEFTPEEYVAQKKQCGWTLATVLARLYYKKRLIERRNNILRG